ncbi:hypothetical protein MIND_01080800 [Mycena indigotica]|uniref:Cupredoxin n=1 Tax=Mycena indigotica TaxID=2126181 RepID=A0A8H6VVH4_9AGAR|nr:uncharacterized protein MIND_01080800 [Mycena indigotica]KAF7295412.1 hypothetical protein MIND_01080800 [Mycena indigotica]
MRFSLVAAATLPVLASAADILVQVGAGGKLAFSPTNITAQVGDTIHFQFQGKNHSVTQSTFGKPCEIQTTPAQGIDSGFQLVPANATELPEWSVTINNDTAPLWFFCAQTIPANHCQAGMVFSVNAKPDSEKSFAAYQALAMSGNAAAAPGGGAAPSGAPAAPGAPGGAPAAPGASSAGADSAQAGLPTGAPAGLPGQGGAAPSGPDAAAALTSGGAPGAPSPSPSGNTTGAGFALAASPVHFLAAFGLAAGLLL